MSENPLIRDSGAEAFRIHLRNDGWIARAKGIGIEHCPYTTAAPPDQWGVQQAVEWLKGWHSEPTYDDLIADLERYGGHDEAYWRTKFPPTNRDALIHEVISVADECPFCLARFLSVPGVTHEPNCPLANE